MKDGLQEVALRRGPSADDGTFGHWHNLDTGWYCDTGELPWRDNHPDLSCIPPGTYLVKWLWSAKHGRDCYHVTDVPGRANVEIHKGNLCGDVAKGYKTDVLGCILPGNSVEDFAPGTRPGQTLVQRGVTESGNTLIALESDLMTTDGKMPDFWLTIS